MSFFDSVDQALNQLPREKIQLATKFGIASFDISNMLVKGTPDYVRSCCEASLKRLDVEYIDLYYQHRVDKSVPIEETVRDFFSSDKPINDFEYSTYYIPVIFK